MSRYAFHYLCLSIVLAACQPAGQVAEDTAEPAVYHNPLLPGFNPDPSICRVGEDYYLVTSTFAYFPGIPILHSKDLVNWTQIGAAITRLEQMDFNEQGVSRGLFAPAITYHDGWFYIICTLIDHGGNFVVRAERPEGPYSEPFWLPELDGGIDPSLFIEDDGRAYVVYNHVAPDNQPLYGGHRTIRARAFDLDSMRVTGEEHLLVNGGVDISQEPVWIEAPHFYRIGDNYYLMCAEGGTSYNHSEVVFRSDSIFGPYEPFVDNPILTQRQLDPTRPNPITSTGHADLVETPGGEWYAVFLGCRPYEGGHYNTGRETFLTPVGWQDGWPIIDPDQEVVQYAYPLPAGAEAPDLEARRVDQDDFSGPPDPRWLQLRTPREAWYRFDEAAGQLIMQTRPQAIAKTGNPSALFKRQPHLYGSATTQVTFTPRRPHELAGLVVMQNDEHYYFLNKTADQVQLLKQTDTGYENLAEAPYEGPSVHLRIVARGAAYDFLYSEDGEQFTPLLEGVDARYLSTETAGGFVGCMYGLYSSSNGTASTNTAVFDYLDIRTEDDPF